MKTLIAFLLLAGVALAQPLPPREATATEVENRTGTGYVSARRLPVGGGAGDFESLTGQPDDNAALAAALAAKVSFSVDDTPGGVIAATPGLLSKATHSSSPSAYTFDMTDVVVDRMFALEIYNSGGSAITVPLTAPGGYTLHSIERNATVEDFDVPAGGTARITFDPKSSSLINVYGIAAPLRWIEEIQLTHPHQVDGTGATMNTTASSATYGHASFSHSADQAANFVIYRLAVPADFDSSVDLQAEFVFRLGGADTGTHRYVISMASVADSASADSPTFSNAINLDFAGDGSGASGDRAKVAWTTLTSWRTSLTAGHTLVIKLARDGDATEDGSTTASTDMNLKLKIGHTQ
jgi:hypothetical protein